jgi:hypothetical protein
MSSSSGWVLGRLHPNTAGPCQAENYGFQGRDTALSGAPSSVPIDRRLRGERDR